MRELSLVIDRERLCLPALFGCSSRVREMQQCRSSSCCCCCPLHYQPHSPSPVAVRWRSKRCLSRFMQSSLDI